MSDLQYLLTALSEECAELSKVACKTSRYGMHGINPVTRVDNANEMISEYHDVIAVIQLLQERGHMTTFQVNSSMVAAKKHKLLTEMSMRPVVR